MNYEHISKNPEYAALLNAIHRCHNEDHAAYPKYGARGITVCEEWRNIGEGGFLRFIEHIGPRPSADLSLDRIDNELGYEPKNVRWATRKTQQNNLSSNLDVETRRLARDIMEKTGLSFSGAVFRIENNKPLYAPRPPRTRKSTKYRRPEAVIKKTERNRGGDRVTRNGDIAKDWNENKISIREIGEKYGISETSVSLICRGKL